MERWTVAVTPEQLSRLSAEVRSLGTLITGQDGQQALMFRDSLAALKVARNLGAQAQPYPPNSSR